MIMATKESVLASIEAANRGPTDNELAEAPLLDNWRVEDWGDHLRLYGSCEDHPEIDDPFVTTSPLLRISFENGWARSRSRWYRLGPNLEMPIPSDQISEYFERLESVLDVFRGQIRAGLEM